MHHPSVDPGRAGQDKYQTRFISGLVLAAITAGVLFLPSVGFLWLVLVPLGLYTGVEWCQLCLQEIGTVHEVGSGGLGQEKNVKQNRDGLIMLCVSALVLLATCTPQELNDVIVLLNIPCLVTSLCLVTICLCANDPTGKFIEWTEYLGSSSPWRFALSIQGLVIQYNAWRMLWLLHAQSPVTAGFWIVATSIVDMAGYFAGKQIPSKEAILNLSPSKTIAGSIAMLLAPIGCALGLWFYQQNPPFVLWVLGPVVLWGDLWVSLAKRLAGVKDTGRIIPGHGGVLDRLDSHIMVLALLHALPFS